MATDANTLLAEAACYDCGTPPGQWQLLKLGLLRQILLASDPVADTSPAALLEAAKCYVCMPPGLWQLLELGLLQQIVAGGGTGGGGGVTCGVVDPVAAPTGSCAIYYRTDTGTIFVWDGAAWL
jgi:hypothetical protein